MCLFERRDNPGFNGVIATLSRICFILFSSLFFITQTLADNNTAKPFIQDFDRFAKEKSQSKMHWIDSASPWAPFLKQQFSKGLSNEQLDESLTLERQERCNAVLTLALKGFNKLYPNLALIFLQSRIIDVFEDEIVPRFSHRYRRCVA